MKNCKVLDIVKIILLLTAAITLSLYLILDRNTYHAPKAFYVAGMIFLLLGSIFLIITSHAKRKRQ